MADESLALETAVLFRLPFSFAKRHHVVIEANQQGWQLYYCGQLINFIKTILNIWSSIAPDIESRYT